MDPKLQAIVESATPKALDRLALRDALMEAVRVSVLGIHLDPKPQLEPEVQAARERLKRPPSQR